MRASQTYAERALHGQLSRSEQVFRGVVQELFPASHVLLPQTNQIYELDLAYNEHRNLSHDDIIRRGAYFHSVNGTPTNHFRVCMNTPDQVNATARQGRKNFFAANVFAVGYATHGLFPYRGKFHPQMIKAVMNTMGLTVGDIVLDPMAGCGTTSIEASIMGIDSISCELSPFGCLMTRSKVAALDMDCTGFASLLKRSREIYRHLAPAEERLTREPLFEEATGTREGMQCFHKLGDVPEPMLELLLLCYLDSVGYARRRKGKTAGDLFPDLLSRYLAAVSAFNDTREELGLALGRARVIQADARYLELPDDSVDGVLFSPPYSFAIDYVENDRPQLQFLGADVEDLKSKMVGLVGSGQTAEQLTQSRVANYFSDMGLIMGQCERVLKPGGYCVVVIGSNTNQTGGVSLENGIVEISERIGMPLEFQIMRQIEGIRNTMRDEFLLFFRKRGVRTRVSPRAEACAIGERAGSGDSGSAL
ncbi:MAG TPA: hypothetical protein VM075_06435 [Anaerolineae bacterium]|nr:hypothetical protein [Anaerolineae bacterium]